MTRIVGMPRKRSAYTIASARIGNSTGPGRPRRTAIPSAATRITTSAMQKTRTLSRKACAISPKESPKIFPSKKARRTAGHPDELTTATTTSVAKTMVLTSAIATPRVPWPLRSPRIRERRFGRPVSASTLSRLLQDGRAGLVREPFALGLRERPVALQRGERVVHARDEAVPLGEHHPEMLRRADGRELADHDAVRRLARARDEERGRQIDDEPVDLVRLQRRGHVRRVVVDGRLLVRLDVLDDVLVARRPELHPELVLLHVCLVLDARDRRS